MTPRDDHPVIPMAFATTIHPHAGGCSGHRAGRCIRMFAILMVCLCLLPGCGDTTKKGKDHPVTITYWTRSWWGDPAQFQGDHPVAVWDWQRQQIAKFESEHPGVKVKVQVDPGGRGDKVRMAFAGGVAPDVFHGGPDTEFVTWANLGLLEPIDAYLSAADRSDIYSADLQAVEYRGRHYAWPLYNHALGVVINRDLFRERGLADRIPTAERGWTMAEFEDLARRLTFDRDGDGLTDVYGVGMHALDANHTFLTTYLVNFGAEVFDKEGRFVLDSPEGIKGLTFLRRLVDEHVATPGVTGYRYADIRSLFVSQRVAMALTGTGTLIYADDQASKGTIKPFDWALVPVPSVRGVESTTFLTIGAIFVSHQTDPAKRDACMALARFLTGHEVNRYFWRAMSPRRSSPMPKLEYQKVMMEQVERAKNFMLPPRPLPERFSLNDEMVRLYQDVLSTPPKATPAEALHALADRVNAALAAESSRGQP